MIDCFILFLLLGLITGCEEDPRCVEYETIYMPAFYNDTMIYSATDICVKYTGKQQ